MASGCRVVDVGGDATGKEALHIRNDFCLKDTGQLGCPGRQRVLTGLGPALGLLEVVTDEQHRAMRFRRRRSRSGPWRGWRRSRGRGTFLERFQRLTLGLHLVLHGGELAHDLSGAVRGRRRLGRRRRLGCIGHSFLDPGRLHETLDRGSHHFLAEGREQPEATPGECGQDEHDAESQASGTQSHDTSLRGGIGIGRGGHGVLRASCRAASGHCGQSAPSSGHVIVRSPFPRVMVTTSAASPLPTRSSRAGAS